MYAEAIFIGIKEGLKLSVCFFLIVRYFREQGRSSLSIPLYAGALVVLVGAFYFLTFSTGGWIREVVVRMTGYVFGLFYIGSLIALYHETGDDMLGPLKRLGSVRFILIIVVWTAAVFYFSPDMIGSTLYLRSIYEISGGHFSIIVAAGAGFILSITAAYKGSRHLRSKALGLFRLSQVLLLLAVIKLIAGGIEGFTELSLIPSVQNGLMKLTHDVLHHTLVTLMVPDHQILSLTAWNALGILFSREVSLWFSLMIFCVPLALFLRRYFHETIQVPDDLKTGATRRKYIRSIMDIRMIRVIPIAIFLIIITGTWFAEKDDPGTILYNPEPVPVVANGGRIIVPIKSPGTDLLDGMLHKYSLSLKGENVRIMVLKKHDGTLSVALDACEICPPDGYAQEEEHVVCLFCRTPIAIDTLGKLGGCNPIPLSAEITDTEVRIDLNEIERKWKIVKSVDKQIPEK